MPPSQGASSRRSSIVCCCSHRISITGSRPTTAVHRGIPSPTTSPSPRRPGGTGDAHAPPDGLGAPERHGPGLRESRQFGFSMTAAATSPDSVPASADSFDFKAYLTRAKATVEQALDAALVPERPESLREAMRYSLLAGGSGCGRSSAGRLQLAGRVGLPFPPRWLWR